MTAAYLEITVEQNGTFTLVIDVLDTDGNNRTDLAGWTGEFLIRKDRNPASDLIADGTVTINATTGVATATLSKAITGAISWRGLAQYDIWITSGDGLQNEPLAWGPARFRPTLIA